MKEFGRVVRVLVVEILIYSVLIALYLLGVLRFLRVPLVNLFHNNIHLYAVACLVLIAGQGVALDIVTTWLVDRLNLKQFE